MKCATISVLAVPPVITVPGGVTTAWVGSPTSLQLSATNIPAFYAASNLPPGLVLNRATGLISGTPRLPGIYRTRVAAANADGTSVTPGGADGAQELLFSVSAPASTPVAPVVQKAAWAPLVRADLGTPFSKTISATQVDLVSRFVLLGELPPGLVLNGATISGTPTQAGIYGAEIAVTNLSTYTTFPVVFYVPPVVPSDVTLSAPATISNAQNRFEIFVTASGPVTGYEAVSLPAGVFFDSDTGRLYGRVPDGVGNVAVVVAAKTAAGWTEPLIINLDAPAVPVFISGPMLGTFTIEKGATASVSIYTGTGVVTKELTGIPAGLTLATDGGSFTGKATEKGVFPLTQTLTNAVGAVTRTEPLVVMQPNWEKFTATWAGTGSIAFGNGRFVRAGTGGKIDYSLDDGETWTAAASGTTTAISKLAYGGGRFAATGAGSVTGSGFVLTSADGVTWTRLPALPETGTALDIAAGELGIIVRTSASVMTSVDDGQNWTRVLTGTFGSTPIAGATIHDGKFKLYGGPDNNRVNSSSDGVTWSGWQTLPANFYTQLELNWTGRDYLRTTFAEVQSSLDGVTWTKRNLTGDFTTVYGVAYGNGKVLVMAGTNVVARNPGTWVTLLTVPPTQRAVQGVPFSLQLSATETPTKFRAHGLPPGLTINESTGLISGTPTLSGVYGIRLGAENALGPGRSESSRIDVEDFAARPPFIAGANWASGRVGVAFAYDPRMSVGEAAYSVAPATLWTTSGLPPGVQLNQTTGALAGVPTQAGVYTVDFTVAGRFAETRHRVNVRVAATDVTTTPMPVSSAGSPGIWHSNGVYAYETQAGSVCFSTDGVQWGDPVAAASDGAQLTGFVFAGGKYVFQSTASVYVSTDRLQWTRQVLPAPANYRGLIYGGGKFVMMRSSQGAAGFMHSTDAVNWIQVTHSTLTADYPSALAYGNGVFVALTGPYYYKPLISTDGETWNEFNQNLFSGMLAFSGGRFLLKNGGGNTTSTDGYNWVAQASEASSPSTGTRLVPFGGGFLLSVSAYPDNQLYGSANGTGWRKLNDAGTSAMAAGENLLVKRGTTQAFVDKVEGRWVFAADGRSEFIARQGVSLQRNFTTLPARTGLSWLSAGLPEGVSISASGVLAGTPAAPGLYQAQVWASDERGIYEPLDIRIDVRPQAGTAPRFWTTTALPDASTAADYSVELDLVSDGVETVSSVTGLPEGFVYDPATRKITGRTKQRGTFSLQISASDEYGSGQWTRDLRVVNGGMAAVADVMPAGLAYNGTTYVAACTGSGIFTSVDGLNWVNRLVGTFDNPVAALNAVVWGGGRFTAVGDAGTVFTSPDGIAWTRRTAVTTENLRAVAYGGSRWVAVGATGASVVSTDGANWTANVTGVSTTLNGVGHDETAFFAVGDSGVIRRSTDGVTWTAITSGTTRTLYAFCYGNGTYLIGSTHGELRASSDGVTWTARSLGVGTHEFNSTRSLVYKAGKGFVVNTYINATSSNRVLFSVNGTGWTTLGGYLGNAQSLTVSDDLIVVGDGTSRKIRVLPWSPAPEFFAGAVAVAYPGVAFHFDTAPLGLTVPISAQGLPAGLTLNAITGTITGATSVLGIHPITISSSGANPVRLSVALHVISGVPQIIKPGISDYVQQRWVRGERVDYEVATLNPVSSWRLSSGTPKLPAGTRFDLDTGHVVGTPTEAGSFVHQLYAANIMGESFGSLVVQVRDTPAMISRQPSAVAVPAGNAAVFSVESAFPAVRFQWYFNGQPLANGAGITGANSAVLNITGAQAGAVGRYDVVVGNGARTELSSAAALTLWTPLAGFNAWASSHAGALGAGGALDAPFGDGVSNLMRYALGLPLTAVTSGDYLETEARDNAVVLRYTKPTAVQDVVYTVEGTRTLQTWTKEGVVLAKVAEDVGAASEMWEASLSLTSQTKGFLRLRIEPAEFPDGNGSTPP